MQLTIMQTYIDHITGLFAAAGHPEPSAWVPEAMQPSEDATYVRFVLNERLRQILAKHELTTGESTRNERMCLINDGPEEEWLSLLERVVVPAITMHRLLSDKSA